MIELTTDTFGDILEGNERVVVLYGATWCGNCRLLKPKFKRFASEYEDITFVYIDAEKFPNARAFAQVDNLPTFAGWHNKEFMGQDQGNKVDNLKAIIDAVANH
jgi:thioredoxin 1